MNSAIRVDIVSDVVCPWCAIGYFQLAKASRDADVNIDVHWHPFELNPQMSEEGENLQAHLAAKYGTTPEESKAARARLTALGSALGFTFDYADDMRMVNTFRAHQLIDWAEDHGLAHQVKLELFSAFFTRRENLNDMDVLADVESRLRLASGAPMAVLARGEKAASVREIEGFWTSRGITGVPAMVFERRYLVTGAQGEDTYVRILRQLNKDQAA